MEKGLEKKADHFKKSIGTESVHLADCPIRKALTLIGGKWRLLIVGYLFDGEMGFGELHKSLPDISEKVLSDNLRALVSSGVIYRKVLPEVPPQTFYGLTERGQALRPIITELINWGQAQLD